MGSKEPVSKMASFRVKGGNLTRPGGIYRDFFFFFKKGHMMPLINVFQGMSLGD